jgi:hypothetical protein
MIIVCCGLAGAGKDEVAKILVSKHNFVKISFASILKDILSILFNWDRDKLEGDTKDGREWRETIDKWWSKKLDIPNFTPRWAMQNIGTDLFRNYFNNNIWIYALEKKIENIKDKNIVITDCRFENEYNFLKNITTQKVCFFYIERNPPPVWFKLLNKDNINILPKELHISEWEWIRCLFSNEYTKILNYGTIDNLHTLIDELIIKL